jgi:hypothetical protein
MRRRDQRIVPTRYDRMLWQTVKQGNLRLTLRLVLYGNNEGPASFPIVLGVDSITVPVRVPCSIDEPIPGRDGLFDFISHDPGFSFPPARYMLTGLRQPSLKSSGKFSRSLLGASL